MMSPKRNILAGSIYIVLYALLIILLVSKVVYAYNNRRGLSHDNSSSIIWAELYPFEKQDIPDIPTENKCLFDTIKSIYCLFFSELCSIGEICKISVPFYSKITLLSTVINSCITNPFLNGYYIKLDNGNWTHLESSPMGIDDTKKTIDSVVELSLFLKEEGIPFIYVRPPLKNCKFNNELPNGFIDCTNIRIDNQVNEMRSCGINVLDIRDMLHIEGLNHNEMFYKTDHHWKVEYGLWISNEIEEAIHNDYGINFSIEHTDRSLYRTEVYNDAMFGSIGHTVTHFVEKSEDFVVLFPDFDTDFLLSIPNLGIDTTGCFKDIFIDYESLHNAVNEGGGYAYETVLYGSMPLIQITNNHIKDGPKILVIRDSFASSVAPYLALGCSKLDLIDNRPSNGNFNGSIRRYIRLMNPDIVILLSNTFCSSYL